MLEDLYTTVYTFLDDLIPDTVIVFEGLNSIVAYVVTIALVYLVTIKLPMAVMGIKWSKK